MLVTLIGKDNLYKIRLPNKKTGDYWITDNESGKKLINIIGKNNEWQIYSNCRHSPPIPYLRRRIQYPDYKTYSLPFCRHRKHRRYPPPLL